MTLTIAPIEAAASSQQQIEFIRLPKPGQLEPHTGLGRSYLNTIILPCAGNNYKPPVRSISLRQRGCKYGVRLIDFQSLMTWIRSHATE